MQKYCGNGNAMLEVYAPGDMQSPDYECGIWVPVCKSAYAYSRNPAFLGFDLYYIGMLRMFYNLLTGMFTVFAIVMLHLQILQEEHYLIATFGRVYLDYRHRVFRYLGRRKG